MRYPIRCLAGQPQVIYIPQSLKGTTNHNHNNHHHNYVLAKYEARTGGLV